jgi:hypothetical protein
MPSSLCFLRGGAHRAAEGGGGIDHSRYQPPEEWAPLTEAELRMIKLMRMRFRDHPGLHDDILLEAVRGFEHAGERWEEATEAALEKILIKRAAVGADEILVRGAPRRSTFCSLYLCGHHGFDRDGHPLYFERTGAIEPRKLFAAFVAGPGEDDVLVNHIFVQEAMRALKLQRTAETGKRIYKHVAITDLAGLGPQHLSKQLLKLVKRIMGFHEDVYPETLHNLYIVNAPGVFAFAWKIVRPWLHPLTAAKVNVLGSRYIEQFQAAGITLDQIPSFLGGEGGELEQFWEPWNELDLPPLDHFLQTTLPGADLQDLGDAAFDEGIVSIGAEDAARLRVRGDDGSPLSAELGDGADEGGGLRDEAELVTAGIADGEKHEKEEEEVEGEEEGEEEGEDQMAHRGKIGRD